MNTTKFCSFLVSLFCLCLLFSNASGQTSQDEVTKTEVKVCRFELTDDGRTMSFRFNYIYIMLTNDEGSPKKIDVLKDYSKYKLVKDESFLPCLRSWKLKPSSKYIVEISVGTTGGDNHILFSKIGGKEPIKLIL